MEATGVWYQLAVRMTILCVEIREAYNLKQSL
jgi:hypothetical protein